MSDMLVDMQQSEGLEGQTKTRNRSNILDSQDPIVTDKTLYWIGKRAFDVLASFTALIVLFPVFLLIAVMIFIDDPKGSPYFHQERVGRGGKVFKFYKFRTMVVDAEDQLKNIEHLNEVSGHAFKIKNDPRVTKFGKFLRRTSLDELPQLWNVLKGDMSIVGPRPPLPREVALYDAYEKQRLYITPGLTCIWQVQKERNHLSFDEWVELDVEYLHKRSWLFDLKLIIKTLLIMITMEGR